MKVPSSVLPRATYPLKLSSRGNDIKQLTHHALVKQDKTSQRFSLHRSVQAQCLIRVTAVEHQQGFDGTVKLLQDKFPSHGSLVIDGKNFIVLF